MPAAARQVETRAGLNDPDAVVRRSLVEADAVATTNVAAARRLEKLLRAADRSLGRRLADWNRRNGGDSVAFTPNGIASYRQQIALAVEQLRASLGGHVSAASDDARALAVEQTIQQLRDLDRAFTGIVRPLRIPQALRLDHQLHGDRSTLLRQHLTSIDRYGAAMIGEFEKRLAAGFVGGMTQGEMVNELTGHRGPRGDVSMRARVEAGQVIRTQTEYIPEGLFTRYRSWAWRIVRTECLLGDTPVTGAMVRAAHRRWYDGNVVEIVTERGRKFTTTPNHPMLSRRGWVGSGELREGDDLVCYLGHEDSRSSRHQNVEAPPPTIAEVFDALSAVGVTRRHAGTEPDFHGDGRQGDVEVACSDRALEIGRFAAIHEPLGHDVFAPADPSRARFCRRCHRLLPSESSAVCRCSDGRPDLAKPLDDGGRIHVEGASELHRALAGLVSIPEFVHRDISPESRVIASLEAKHGGLGLSSEDAGLLGEGGDGAGFEPGSCGYSDAAEPGSVEFDRVVSLRIRHFSGHVYNLTTVDGYFAINGVYTGNTSYAYNAAKLDTFSQLRRDGLPSLKKKIVAHFDRRTAPDSIAVHGQIRDVDGPNSYFVDGDARVYQHPPARPNDRETVLPWLEEWGESEATRPLSPSEVQTADAASRAGRTPPAPGTTGPDRTAARTAERLQRKIERLAGPPSRRRT